MTNGIKEGINLADKKSEKTLDRVVDGLKSCIDILEKVKQKRLEKASATKSFKKVKKNEFQ